LTNRACDKSAVSETAKYHGKWECNTISILEVKVAIASCAKVEGGVGSAIADSDSLANG
jgi:hypothetical protein